MEHFHLLGDAEFHRKYVWGCQNKRILVFIAIFSHLAIGEVVCHMHTWNTEMKTVSQNTLLQCEYVCAKWQTGVANWPYRIWSIWNVGKLIQQLIDKPVDFSTGPITVGYHTAFILKIKQFLVQLASEMTIIMSRVQWGRNFVALDVRF